MSEELIRVALARHLPAHRDDPIRRLTVDGSAFAVGVEVIARFRLARPQGAVLDVLRDRSTVAIPRPVFVDGELDVLAYRRIPGAPLAAAELTAQGLALTAFLDRLHGTYVGTVDRVVPAARAEDVDPEYALAVARERRDRLVPDVTAAVRALVDRALALAPPQPTRARVLCHLALGREHLLADPATGEVTGVVGWGGAAIADPARDLGGVLARLGRAMFDAIVAGYRSGFDGEDAGRAEVYARCLLLEQVEVTLAAGDRDGARAALRRLQLLVRGT